MSETRLNHQNLLFHAIGDNTLFKGTQRIISICFQIEYYCQVARTLVTPSDDIEEWWGTKGKQFPMLQKVAKST